jgi:membrane peptidoglycan carboxypeptidase
MHATPYAITRVENARGEVLWAPEPQRESVLSAEEAFLMVSMMKDVNQRGTAYGAVWGAGFKLPSAGKTGTTDDGADVWYVGYTPDLVAGVWIGMDRPQKVKANAQGGELAAPAWTTFMTEVYRRKPTPPDWPRPCTASVARQVIAATNVLYAEGGAATTEPGLISRAGAVSVRPGQSTARQPSRRGDSARRARVGRRRSRAPAAPRPRARSTTSAAPPQAAARRARRAAPRRGAGDGTPPRHRAGVRGRPHVPPA